MKDRTTVAVMMMCLCVNGFALGAVSVADSTLKDLEARSEALAEAGASPLLHAVAMRMTDAARQLAEKGADVNFKNKEGEKPVLPPDKVPIRFDHTDPKAVRSLIRPMEAAFYKSVEQRDMTGFHRLISKQWQNSMTVAEMNKAFRLLMMLDEPRRYWKGGDFVVDRAPYLQENNTLAVDLRYATTNEHVFISHVYFPENGEWKMGSYNLAFRPYNEAWECQYQQALASYREGLYEQAVSEAIGAMRTAASLDPPNARLSLIAAEALADMHAGRSNFEESARMRLFILDVLLKTRGKTDPLVAEQLDQLMAVFFRLGRKDLMDLCNIWGNDVRAAAAGDQGAAKRIETGLDVERLRGGKPGPAPPGENPKLTALRSRAEGGDAKAQYDLSMAYSAGQYGLEKDKKLAAQWALRAAEQGHAGAMYVAGVNHEYGSGTEQDMTRAVEWYRKAAAHQSKSALYKMGTLYEKGKGVSLDVDQALQWYRRAQNVGHPTAGKKIAELTK